MYNENQVPTHGYLLELWDMIGYRSTAYAYLKREGLLSIQHRNGKWYSLEEINNAMII
mgnify:FL=1